MNKPTIALISIFFLITPYNVNEVAKEIEIQGNLPALNARMITPIVATRIAIICPTLNFSPRNKMPTRTYMRGFI